MRHEIIGTGSRGNCVVINDAVAIDMGVPYKAISKHAKSLKIIFLTHSHFDHFRGSTVSALAADRPALRFAAGEWLAKPLVECGVKKASIDILEPGRPYSFGGVAAEPFRLFHSVPNMGYKLTIGGERMIYATDTGSLDGIEAKDFDYYFIEANHTEKEISERIAEKLREGKYPYEQRARENHLSKEKADDFIYGNIGQNGIYVYLHTHFGLTI
jgi:phosphoribosyl 1,2-cyclic phosphodiesterase